MLADKTGTHGLSDKDWIVPAFTGDHETNFTEVVHDHLLKSHVSHIFWHCLLYLVLNLRLVGQDSHLLLSQGVFAAWIE